MAEDLNKKLMARLEAIEQRLQRQERANPLESASVTNGQIRIIGGTIRVDGGGNLIVNGTMSVNGTSTVTGSFTVSGPWNLSGMGTISGNVTITGNVTSTGTLTQNGPWNMNGVGTIAGNVTATGSLTQNGPWTLNGAGTIAGNVVQTGNTDQKGNVTVNGGGKITVAGGGGDVVLDSSYSDPRITLGSAQINGGTNSFTFNSGAQIVYFVDNTIRVPGMATKAASTVPGGFVGAVYADLAGKFWRLT